MIFASGICVEYPYGSGLGDRNAAEVMVGFGHPIDRFDVWRALCGHGRQRNDTSCEDRPLKILNVHEIGALFDAALKGRRTSVLAHRIFFFVERHGGHELILF